MVTLLGEGHSQYMKDMRKDGSTLWMPTFMTMFI